MPSSSVARWTRSALTLVLATITSLVGTMTLAEDVEMVIASGFGPTSDVPDPRARQNGWLANRAGVSETLIGLGYDMSMQPRLAVAYENLSPTQWKVTLREGVLFHDGTPMTAQSVKASFEKFDVEGHPGHNPRLSKLLGLESIDVTSETTLVFTTTAPNSAFLWSLTEPAAAVMKDGTDAFPLIGTGPFVFEMAQTDKTYAARGFADYWGGTPKLDRLVFDTIPDASVAALALQAGDVDLVTHYPEPEFAKLQEAGESQLFAVPTTRLYFMQARVNGGPLAEPALRQAISLGLDRDTIVEAALAGVGGDAAQTVFPTNMESWVNADLTLPYDPTEAQAILDTAGIVDSDGNGIRELNGEDVILKIRSYEGRPALRPTLEISQAMLSQIGIGAEIAMGEWNANNDALQAGEIDIHLQAWGTAPQGDPDYFPSTLAATGGSYNVGGYQNAELDELLEKGRTLFDNAERKPIYAEVQAILNRDLPLIPLFHKTQVSVGNGKIEGFRIHPSETYLASPELTIAR
ncbi:ABC transporter substrate-binding protein [Actibacterium sp. 188UL27-1]|uniref:ABC transporter substrate-binding protein n=1 Tax=Actibacterium sp. 188UL27-1 TaxID=2786961 RepID=UPI00195EFD44|nr:ABC transporter substrate-binding protein [Actibacterium sp. 188UL27-1]MBM7068821.1 ABC transporter substrate-binding protein [Actibacterium sp. 188UL27-1]